MHVVVRREHAVVLDDVLPTSELDALVAHVQRIEYTHVHANAWDKAWPLSDGAPLRGPSVYWDPSGRRPVELTWPTGTPMDQLVDAVRQAAHRHEELLGIEGEDWGSIGLSTWLYPAGSALSPHRDSGRYTGSFTFFLNPRWPIEWGGLLLLIDGEPPTPVYGRLWPDDSAGDGDPPASATCVVPRRNRLVLIGNECLHMISRVDACAGDAVRTTVAGFFVRRV
jgi:hypothetical protein